MAGWGSVWETCLKTTQILTHFGVTLWCYRGYTQLLLHQKKRRWKQGILNPVSYLLCDNRIYKLCKFTNYYYSLAWEILHISNLSHCKVYADIFALKTGSLIAEKTKWTKQTYSRGNETALTAVRPTQTLACESSQDNTTCLVLKAWKMRDDAGVGPASAVFRDCEILNCNDWDTEPIAEVTGQLLKRGLTAYSMQAWPRAAHCFATGPEVARDLARPCILFTHWHFSRREQSKSI